MKELMKTQEKSSFLFNLTWYKVFGRYAPHSTRKQKACVQVFIIYLPTSIYYLVFTNVILPNIDLLTYLIYHWQNKKILTIQRHQNTESSSVRTVPKNIHAK
jgi:hypothetical protein